MRRVWATKDELDIRGDLKLMELTEDMAQDRKLWRARISTCSKIGDFR